MEENRRDEPVEKEIPKFRGLYRHVKISVRALDWVIVACIAAILLVFVLELDNLGFTVRFDSKGGTDVPSQTYMYGAELEQPQPPTREGYRFTGWYKDPSCVELWDPAVDKIYEEVVLYAGWELDE